MIEYLHHIDLWLFNWINHSWSNPFFDKVFEFLSGNAIFYPLLACVIIFLWLIAVALGSLERRGPLPFIKWALVLV